MPASTSLTPSDRNLLLRYLAKRTGFRPDQDRWASLECSVRERMEALSIPDFSSYFRRLSASPHKAAELGALMDAVTVKESAFFRHEAQFRALEDHCIPHILSASPEKTTLRIWSAGCSRGEEPYSIAMVVRACRASFPEVRATIRATDISPAAIAHAKRGLYSEHALRYTPERYRRRFFRPTEDQRYEVIPEIRHMVRFETLNLMDAPGPATFGSGWDVIFCRNVIIYFSRERAVRLLGAFTAALSSEGFFFSGYSEMLRYLSPDLAPVEIQGTFVYCKAGPRPAGRRCRPVATPAVPHSSARARTAGAGESTPQKSAERRPSRPSPVSTGKALADRIREAQGLADQGRTQAAMERLDAVLSEDPEQVEAIVAAAAILHSRGSLAPAESYYKRALYLAPRRLLPRYYLADVYRAMGRREDAAREYGNVIDLLETGSSQPTDLEADGFTTQGLLRAARTHLTACRRSIP